MGTFDGSLALAGDVLRVAGVLFSKTQQCVDSLGIYGDG